MGASSAGSASAGSASAGDTIFRPVRPVNAFEETVERLLQAIRLGVVAPGERLPAERDLAARFSVSRVTLREAIRALQQSGHVESRRGRYGGTFVTVVSRSGGDPRALVARMGPDDLADVLLFREVVEAGAAAAAASRALTGPERTHLRDRLTATATADLLSYRRMDSRLHLAIAEVTGSPSLVTAVAEQRMRVNELLDAIPLLERNIAHSNEQHEVVVGAVLGGDREAARRRMLDHLEGTTMLLRGFLG